jgi:pSer/pThr/pTyr-binding forkhead associated (FHA) protein
MDVRLVIFRSDGTTREIPVKPGRYVVGRKPDAGLRIPIPSVSRDHCELVHDGKSLSVRDLGSSNGTFKNQERIKQATLAAGDRLGVGAIVFTVQIDGKPVKLVPPAAPAADDEDDMMDTPVGSVTKTAPAAGVSPEDSGLIETVMKPQAGPGVGGKNTDDSSIFEFDFDFEDDDRPKL